MRRLPMEHLIIGAALILCVPGCSTLGPQKVADPEPVAQPAPRQDLEPVSGAWEAMKRANLRGGPGTDFPVIGGVAPGEPLQVLGRAPGTEWFAVALGSGTAARRAFIHTRLVHQTAGAAAPPARMSWVAPKPMPDAVPAPQPEAAPRIAVTAPQAVPPAQAIPPAPAIPSAQAAVPAPVRSGRPGEWVATGQPVVFTPAYR